MNNQEILIKAIEKAIANGCTNIGRLTVLPHDSLVIKDEAYTGVWEVSREGSYNELTTEEIIFDHDFAKALWGDERLVIVGNTDWRTWPLMWQQHLMQMVIADDPIKYLGENLPDATDTDSDVLTASELESQEGDTGGQTR
jgi:hypothetical protein